MVNHVQHREKSGWLRFCSKGKLVPTFRVVLRQYDYEFTALLLSASVIDE
jgi:hypothetical protein